MPAVPQLYLVTDRHRTNGRALPEVVEQALRGGVDAVQLREKDLPGRSFWDLARELRALCERYGALLLVNDRLDVAKAVGADGVHLPVQSFTPREARAILGRSAIVGCSCHSLEEALRATDQGADFLVCGPVFDTPSKRAFGPPLGLEQLRDICARVSIPVLAIGGVTAETIPVVRSSGAYGIAVIRAVLEAPSPFEAARQLKHALTSSGTHSEH
ncbi:MAG: thiamine phosphate synthase [Candidatus Binatia bacterium]|nr:thiamine phosphate synthase [Candidatus Binatia bacterium]